MSQRLLVSGGGESEDFFKLDKSFVQSLAPQSKILLLPFANDESDYEDTFERISETFSSLGDVEVEMVQSAEEISLDVLNQFAAVYIDGGNTFQLINTIRSTHLAQDLKSYYLQGGILYGDSAGAIIFGQSVQTAFLGEEGDDNEAALQSFHGMDLAGSFSFHCHYSPEDTESIQDFVYDSGSCVLALPEPCGIIIQDGQVQVFGKEALQIFNFSDRRQIEPGESIDLTEFGYQGLS